MFGAVRDCRSCTDSRYQTNASCEDGGAEGGAGLGFVGQPFRRGVGQGAGAGAIFPIALAVIGAICTGICKPRT